MRITFTQKFTFFVFICLVGLLQFATTHSLYAQGNSVPIINVDLTGKPNGTWTSASITRNGQICNVDKNSNCVQFNITLDKNSGGLEFAIASGPVPSGSMAYQISCGTPVPVGQPICVTGTGPHVLTICMPGAASNTYVIKSIAAFTEVPDVAVTTGCSTTLQAPLAFEESSITWRDISGQGYEKYLSFPNGKSKPIVTPDANAPAYVDYEVCGRSVASPCSNLPYCDVVRVYFYPPPVVTVGPTPAIICPGGSGVVLTGNVTGGDGNFDYIWTDGAGNVVANTQNYTATAVGTYSLDVRTRNYPNCQKFSASVNVVTNLSINAGPDQLGCSSNNVQLAGSVTAATGGVWSGGTGTFSDRNSLNAVYTPSAADISAGSVKLTLTSTGNGSCTAVSDEVLITFYNMNVSLTGSQVICNGTLASIKASVTGAQGAVTYRWNTGETTATINNKPAGTYTVTVSDGQNCSIVKSFTVTQVYGPSDFIATLKPSTCGNSNGEIIVGAITNGTAPYTYSKDGATFQASATITGLAAGSQTITVKDANGCTFSKAFTLTNTAGPTAVAATAQPASCANNNGSITAGLPTGGTSPYTYSINGTTFQTGTTFTGLTSGTYTVTAKDANGCTVTTSVPVVQSMPTDFTATAASSTCANSNGSVTVGAVTGGVTPYTYSKDGNNFQVSATLTGLAAGTHTITVKDANGCTFAKQVAVSNIAGPSDITATLKPSTCGNSNGEITVSTVGGTAGYTYSKDGTNFQASATFTGLAAGSHTITVKDANGCTFSRAFTLTNTAGPTALTATAQAASCADNNGSITAGLPTGGTSPYTYSINGTTFQAGTTFTGLASGTYTVTAKDANGCTVTTSVAVAKSIPTDFTVTAASSTCGNSNGSITVGAVTGGFAPYTYSKNGTTFQSTAAFTGLAAGTHTITIKDARGCTFAKDIVVSNIAGPSDLTVSVKASTCGNSNGEFTVGTVTGGTAPYTYSIDGTNYQSSTTFVSRLAGDYQVRVKDANGCIYTEAVLVPNVAGPSFTAAAQSSTCGNSNGQISITVTGGTAPFTFSKDGTTFQTSSTFNNVASGTYTITVKDANNCLQTASVVVNNIAGPINLTLASTSSTCGSSNGSISVGAVAGGTAPYTYSIDGSTFQSATTFGSLTARGYTVTVKDANGCIFAKAITVTNIAGPTDFAATISASTCGNSNGQFTVNSVTGGTAPYTYSLDGSAFQSLATFTALAAKSYTITIKDVNGCTFAKQVMVGNMAGPAGFTAVPQSSSCGRNNGSIRVAAVSGGTAPYTYSSNGSIFQASDTFAALVAGTYTITVKDANGCVITQSVVVEDVAGPAGFVLTAASSTCSNSNGTITVGTVSGGVAPYTYSSNGTTFQAGNSFTALAAGSYTITVKDANGCTFARQVAVTNIAGPTNMLASLKATTCGASNGELTVTNVTGGTEPYTYSKNGTTFQASAVFTGLAAGTHSITVKDANGCTFVKSFTITNIAGPTAVAASPQPASCANNDGSIAVGNVTGGTAPYTYSINGTNFQSEVAFAGLASGTYTVTAKDANGCVVTTSVNVGKNVPTTFASSSVSSTCGNSNGSITVGAVTGGFAPYTYSKDGNNFQVSATLTGFVAGTHTITVKDARGCIIARQVTVTNVAGPSDLVASVTSSTCGNSNGALTITGITGGTAPYTYSKDGANFQASATFTALASGTHTITVKDANGCTFVEEVVVNNIAGPEFTATAQASTCGSSNGSITVNAVTAGTAPYTYSIDGTTFRTTPTFTGLTAATYTITVKDANGCLLAKAVEVEDIAGPDNMTLVSVASTCGSNNGSISVKAVSGGTAPYTYSINGTSFQSLSTFAAVLAGEHTVIVKDANGCTFAKKVVVENIAGPGSLTASTIASTCGSRNGKLTVTNVSGGTAPYTYSKDGVNFQESTTFTDLLSGQHTITVKDANGCTVAKVFTVTNIAGPSAVAATSQPATCADNNGSISLGAVSGGTAPYTYSINGTSFQAGTSFTGLASGDYTVTVKDANGCQVTAAVTINKNVPTSFASSTVASTCGRSDGSITVGTVTGGTAPYTYSINGGAFQASATFTDQAAGYYTIAVKDANGCTFAREVAVSNVYGPVFTATAQKTTCGSSNGNITLSAVTGGVGPYTYSKDGITFQASTVFSNLVAGTYTITAKDANGCLGTKIVVVEDIAGPSELDLVVGFSTCGNSNASITVSKVTGGTAPYTYSKDGTNFQATAVFANLAAGTHTITVKDANGCTFAKAVTIENVAGPADLSLVATASTCGSNNGVVSVNAVSGGTAPFTFAIDGTTFQSEGAFRTLVAGEYTITVKDANGCTFARKVTVTNIAGPANLVADISSSTCGASNGALNVTNVTGGTAPYMYSNDGVNFQESAAFTALSAGSYTITVKDANGCTFAKAFTLADIAGPSAVATTTQAATCADNDGVIRVGTVTGGTAPYTYSINGTNFQAGTTFSALASGVYSVTVKDANGCEVSASVTVIKDGPAKFSSATVASTCGRSNGSVTVTSVTGGTAPYTYRINGEAFQATATFSGLNSGTYTITVKDANGCTYADQVKVNDVAGPGGLVASAQSTTCGASNGSISVTSVTEGTAPYTYSINGVNFQASAAFTALAAGEYQVTVKDANGCIFTKAVVVSNTSGPSDFAMDRQATTCSGTNGQIGVRNVTGGTAPYTYSINKGAYQASATFTGLAAGTHTVTVKDGNGCTFIKTVVIEDIAGPAGFDVAAVSSICGASNGSVTVSAVTGGTAPYTYALNGAAFQASASFTAILAGEHTITVKDANGCTVIERVTVGNIAGPAGLSADATPASCAANDGTIAVKTVTGGTAPYTYSLDGITYQPQATFTGLAVREYTVYAKDANGCTTQQTVTVSSKGPKDAVVTAIPSACGQKNGAITITSVTGGTLPLLYSIDGVNFQASASFQSLSAGSYTVTIKDAEGCTFTKSQNVGNNGGAESFTLTATDAGCGNKNGKIVIGQISGGQSPYTYSINGTAYQSSPEFLNLAEGSYQVSVKDASGCVKIETATIKNSLPITNAKVLVSAASCGLTKGQVQVQEVTGGTSPYTYSLDGNNFSASSTLTDVLPGIYTLTIKDASNCTYTTQVKVESTESKVKLVQDIKCAGETNGSIAFTTKGWNEQTEYSIDNGLTFRKDSVFTNLPKGVYKLITRFSPTCTITVGTVEVKEPAPLQVTVTPLTPAVGQTSSGSASVTVSGGKAPYTYQLDNGNFGAATLLEKLSPGVHTLVVKDSNGCTAKVTFTIESIESEITAIEIPTGFTPNGDGTNDTWVLKNLSVNYPNCKVTVYNRWGSPVFESLGYKKEWDGTYKGGKLPDGTYYFIIELGDSGAPIKKTVTIMR